MGKLFVIAFVPTAASLGTQTSQCWPSCDSIEGVAAAQMKKALEVPPEHQDHVLMRAELTHYHLTAIHYRINSPNPQT
eukprot:1847724-Amphidinium_carterae.1